MPFQFRKEAIEEDLNTNFPSQGQGNPPLYYSLSEVVVPTYSINSVAEGSGLPQNLQIAWDFSTGHSEQANSSSVIINNPGFWLVDLNSTVFTGVSVSATFVTMTDGISLKTIWQSKVVGGTSSVATSESDSFVIFLRSGDSVTAGSNSTNAYLNISYRQIATANGTLVNPLGFSAA